METFKKGTICIRCGTSKKDAGKYSMSCGAWGKYYGKHLWNTKEFSVVVQIVSTNPGLLTKKKI